MWSAGQLAKHLGIERTTIHDRTAKYGWAFSKEAVPDKGRHRHYSARDVAVMIELHRLLKAGLSEDEIETSLQGAIRRNQFDDIEQYPEVADTSEELMPTALYQRDLAKAEALVAAAQRETQMARAEADGLREEKVRLTEAVKRLEEQLATANTLLAAAPDAQERMAELREQLADARARLQLAEDRERLLQQKEAHIQQLQRMLGQAQTDNLWLNDQVQKLTQLLDEERNKKKGFWR